MRLFRRRPADPGGDPDGAGLLPDPSRPPQNRGTWEQAAITNVEVTEIVKRRIGTITRPWQK
jgi:hypothetical protein